MYVRYLTLLMPFLATMINHKDGATSTITISSLQKDLGIDTVTLGFIFSVFSWEYVAGKISRGFLSYHFGSKKFCVLSTFIWSLFTLLQGYIGELQVSTIVTVLLILRTMDSLTEILLFSSNARIVAAWFPGGECGTYSAILTQ